MSCYPLVLGTWYLVLGTWYLVLGTWYLVLGTFLQRKVLLVLEPECQKSNLGSNKYRVKEMLSG